MVYESSLAAKSTQFSDSMQVRPAPTVEKTTEENGQDSKTPEQSGDMVSISKEARALAAPEKQETSLEMKKKDDSKKDESAIIKMLKERIETLEKEIQELKDGDLPEKEKNKQVMDKQSQLTDLRDQLTKAQAEELKAQGMSATGGTRANGAGNSVASF